MRLRRSLAAFFVLSLVLLAIVSAPAVAQTTIHVPADQPTIQAGINAASNGDIVLVAPNTYYENIDFKGKGITVTSSGGPATTIIDGGNNGPAVTFKTGETRSAILSNFTVQHGGSFGSSSGIPSYFGAGAVQVNQSAPTILNNVITLSNCWGIEFSQAAPLIQGNEISATQDPYGQCSFGGGAAIYAGGNLGGPNPGSSSGTPAIIVGNTIENNVESGNEDAGGNGGAAIAVWGGSPQIENNVLRNNASPGGSGGAINIQYGSRISIVQNLIYGNSAGCGGGAIAFSLEELYSATDVLIANNTMVNNVDAGRGGFTECTNIGQIYPNPDSYGEAGEGGIIVNNIISGSTSYPSVNCSAFGPPTEWTQPVFDHNVLYNTGGAFFGNLCIDVSAKYGNIAADPRLLNPAAGDFHLSANSPAIDSGNNSALALLQKLSAIQLDKDFDGNMRVQDASAKGYPVIDIGAYEFAGAADGSPTTVVVTPSSFTGNAGNTYTFTATLSSQLGIPTGSVSFYVDGNLIGPALINSAGVATLSNFLLTPGVHNVYASYLGQGNFPPAISVVVLVNINLYATNLSLSGSPNPALVNQSVIFTVQVSSADPSYIPSPITLTDQGVSAPLAALIPDPSSGIASYPTSALAVGTHLIIASYAGDTQHASQTALWSQRIVAGYTTSTAVVCVPSSATVNQSVACTATVTNTSPSSGAPSGSVMFSDGTNALGTSTLTQSGSLTAIASIPATFLSSGNHTITATYLPTGGFAASSGTFVEYVTGLPSTTTLTGGPNPAFFGTIVSFTATVTGSATMPTGTISFYEGSTLINSGALDVHGQITLGILQLPVGTHTLTAVYSGNSTYSASTSAPFTEVILPLPQDFTITLASPTISIKAQHHITTTVTLASVNGFADSLALSCANLPQYVTCRPTPTPASLAANGTAAVSLYLDTDSVLGYAHLAAPAPPSRPSAPISLALLLSPLSLLAFARKSRRASLRLLMLLLALLPVSLALSGCGEIILPYDPPPFAVHGTYTIPITATGATTHISHTASLTLTITP